MINEAIMRLFKAFIVLDNKARKTETISEEALYKGLLIDKNCPDQVVRLACKIWGKDGFLLNQTFHKSLQTVVNTDRSRLLAHQLMHYFTTYGLERFGLYEKEYVYIPKEKLEIPELLEDIELIPIQGFHTSELKERLWALCNCSIALSAQTVKDIVILSNYLELSVDNIDNIKNKEVKIALCDKVGILPSLPESFVRYLIYQLTGQTLLIKDNETIYGLKTCNKELALHLLNRYHEQYGFSRLSEVFQRFKPIFLALKTKSSKKPVLSPTDRKLNAIVNKLSHLSKIYHKPMQLDDLDRFVTWCFEHRDDEDLKEQLESKIEKSGIWRAIKLRNYLSYKKKHSGKRVYKIRNGRCFIVPQHKDKLGDPDFILDILDNIIVSRLRKNVATKTFYIEEDISLVLPQSEKQFVGNIPFGSSITFNRSNLIFGIHWYNIENERVDLDLHLISDKYNIGWNANFNKDDKLIFSGDMTDAPYPNGASEYIYVGKNILDTMFSLKVNNYTCNIMEDVTFDIIIAKGYSSKLNRNHVIDPNDIIVRIPNNKIERCQWDHLLGTIVIDRDTIRFIFTDLCNANRIVAKDSALEKTLRSYVREENKCACQLKEYLVRAGAILADSKIYMGQPVDMDLSLNCLNKDTLIKLFC